MNDRFGFWIAQIVIFILFSVEHVLGGMTWLQAFIGAGVGALLFGIAALRSNGIAFPIGIHFAWNFGQWCLGFKKEEGLLQGLTDKGFDNVIEQNGWIGYLVVMAIFIVTIFLYKPKLQPS